MLKVSFLLQARERVTGPLRQIRAGVRSLVRDGEGQLNRLGRSLDRVGRQGRAAGIMISSALRRAGQVGFNGLLATARRAAGGLRNILRGGLQIGALGVTAGAGYLLWQLTGRMVEVTSQFEQFQVVLENTEGSAAGARRAMAWVRNFAQTTPYEVGDVMEAFVRLRAYGIDPTQGAMRSLGNAASGMNKSIMDAVEMLADAQTGEFERLKEFGIRARVTGDQVRFSYMRNGRDMVRTVRNNAAEIQRAVTGIFDETFSGMMDRQSRTLSGLWSNLKDQWTNFQLAVGQAGIFDLVKSKVQQLLNRVNQLAQNGTLQRWARDVSQRLEGFVNLVANTDWAAIGQNIKSAADGFLALGNALSRVASFGSTINQFSQLSPLGQVQRVLSGQRPGLSMRFTVPRWLYDGIRPMTAVVAERAREAQARAAQAGRSQRGNQPRTPQPVNRRLLNFWLRPPSVGPRFNVLSGFPMGPAMRQQAPAARPQEVRVRSEVGGRIGLQIGLSPEVSARLTRLETANNDVPITLGRGVAGLFF